MTDPTPIRQAPDVPVFGRRTTPITYRRFDLEYRMAANPADVRTESFEVATDLDGGSLYAVMSAQTEAQQMVATARLMAQGLRDDDGVSASYLQPAVPMTWDELDEANGQVHALGDDDDEDDAATAARRAELTACTVPQLRTIAAEYPDITVPAKPVKRRLVEDILAAEVAPDPEGGDADEDDEDDDGFARDEDGLLYYLGPDGPTTDVTTLIVKHAEGSSRRRLAEIMDHPRYVVEASALTEISRWLVREQAGRPTRKPRPSQTGPRRTGRGSRGR